MSHTSQNQTAKPFRIILRYGLDPFNGPVENLKQLENFIRESTIDEVMFLLMPEERSSGHPTEELSQPWIEVIQQAKEMFARYGVATSLNPWTTTYHAGRGRRLHAGQDFRLMVGETGAGNGISPCPLCENWQHYLNEYFVFLARAIEPVALWVEDDWRLHNHGKKLGYGGCFCDHCLARFAPMVDRDRVTREEVVATVAASGEPHPWRAKWLELSRQVLQEPAEKLTAALKTAAPEMRIGLMTSIPDVHSIENRDWNGLMNVFTDDKERYLIRPHMPPYTEEPPITTSPGFSRQTIANLDRDADIYPELENSPRSGSYSGSHAYSAWEIYNAILYGARGITINHFDNMGMNTYYDRGFGASLGRQRPFFDALMNLRLDDRKARGVKILFSPDVASYKWTEPDNTSGASSIYQAEDTSKIQKDGQSLGQLKADSIAWSKAFYVMGVSHSFTREVKQDPEAVYAVSDQTLRCLSDAEIEELLAQKVILDLPSTEILVQRGFGSLIGVNTIKRVTLEETAYSLEEIEPSLFGELEGGVQARTCALRCANPIGQLDYTSDVELLSMIKDPEFEPKFPGSGLFRNRSGGIVYTCCYPLGSGQFYMAYFNRVRQEYWTKVLFRMSGAGGTQTIACGHPLHLHSHNIEDGVSIAATNIIYDETDRFDLLLPAEAVDGKVIRVLDKDANWNVINPTVQIEGALARICMHWRLRPLQSLFLTLREK